MLMHMACPGIKPQTPRAQGGRGWGRGEEISIFIKLVLTLNPSVKIPQLCRAIR